MSIAPVTSEQLAGGARAQTGMPGATVHSPRRAWEDRVPGIWGVTVEDPERRRNAFLRVSDGRVTVPAGMPQAARELRAMQPLDGQDWGGGLIYVVMAAGGATPGFPDTVSATESASPDGAVRITLRMAEANVAYAAAGGVGPMPSAPESTGGLAPSPPMSTATLDIGPDYSLRWRYELGVDEPDGPSGEPAGSPPALADDVLVAALDGARLRAGAPRAMPTIEPRLLEGHDDVVAVDLFALGTVYVHLGRKTGAAGHLSEMGIDWDAQPDALVPLLCAAAALPVGILPGDLRGGQIAGGEMIATVPAPLVEWSAGGATYFCPRVAGVSTAAQMSRPGRVRLALDGSLRWTLEVADRSAWRLATGAP